MQRYSWTHTHTDAHTKAVYINNIPRAFICTGKFERLKWTTTLELILKVVPLKSPGSWHNLDPRNGLTMAGTIGATWLLSVWLIQAAKCVLQGSGKSVVANEHLKTHSTLPQLLPRSTESLSPRRKSSVPPHHHLCEWTSFGSEFWNTCYSQVFNLEITMSIMRPSWYC